MGNFKIVSLLMVMAGVIYGTDEQLKITPFEKVTDGVLADWNSTDGANVEGSTEKFGAAMTWDATKETGKLWLVSRRYISVVGGPAQLVKPGGIVSTLQLPNKTWTHQPHELDMNGIEIKVFSLGGHLLMLTYENENVIKYRNLYVWNETDWAEIPFDSSGVENPRGRFIRLSISGPDPWNNAVYLAASAYTMGKSEATIAKLEIAFDSSSKTPIRANLTSMHRATYSKEGSIACTPFLPVFNRVYEFWNVGSTIQAGKWFSIDSNRTKGFAMNVSNEEMKKFSMDVNKDNCFQYRYEAIFFGQNPSSVDGTLVPHVWAYDLRRQKMRHAINASFAEITIMKSPKVVADRSGAIYAIDLEKGVYEARISYDYGTANARRIDEEDDGPRPPPHGKGPSKWPSDEDDEEETTDEPMDDEEEPTNGEETDTPCDYCQYPYDCGPVKPGPPAKRPEECGPELE